MRPLQCLGHLTAKGSRHSRGLQHDVVVQAPEEKSDEEDADTTAESGWTSGEEDDCRGALAVMPTGRGRSPGMRKFQALK